MDSNVGLYIHEEWINLILSRSKSWEIRGTPCKKHIGKRIALIQCGMKGKKSRIVGGVTIVGSKEIINDQILKSVLIGQKFVTIRIRSFKVGCWIR